GEAADAGRSEVARRRNARGVQQVEAAAQARGGHEQPLAGLEGAVAQRSLGRVGIDLDRPRRGKRLASAEPGSGLLGAAKAGDASGDGPGEAGQILGLQARPHLLANGGLARGGRHRELPAGAGRSSRLLAAVSARGWAGALAGAPTGPVGGTAGAARGWSATKPSTTTWLPSERGLRAPVTVTVSRCGPGPRSVKVKAYCATGNGL